MLICRVSEALGERSTHAAHLLGQHDHLRGVEGAAAARDGEELHGAGNGVRGAHDLGLLLELSRDVVEVAGGLELSVAELRSQPKFMNSARRALRNEAYADE